MKSKFIIPILLEIEDKKIIVYLDKETNKVYQINAAGLAEESKISFTMPEQNKMSLSQEIISSLKEIKDVFNK